MAQNELSVRLYGDPVGVLTQPTGRMVFTYLPEAKDALSVSMPIRTEPYQHDVCEAFFGNLLPETHESRKLIALRFGANPNSTFSLLAAIGYDCAGAVSLHSLDEAVVSAQWHDLECRELSASELAEHILQLPRQPLMAGVEGIRLSLAGAQDKAAICMVNNRIALPVGGTPTSHILKPAIEGLDDTVANEYFTMRLAKHMGLPVAPVEMREVQNIPFLLVTRYDRVISADGARIRRVHQEDFCQALAVRASAKYQNAGGPNLQNCFDLLTRTNRPAQDRNVLAGAIIFNFLAGNRDAHAKNFALLHDGSLRFAPLYDLVATAIYRKLDASLAMSIGGKYDPADVMPRHWQRMCEDSKYSYPFLRGLLIKWSEKLPPAARALQLALEQEQLQAPVSERIVDFIQQSCDTLAKRMKAAETGSSRSP